MNDAKTVMPIDVVGAQISYVPSESALEEVKKQSHVEQMEQGIDLVLELNKMSAVERKSLLLSVFEEELHTLSSEAENKASNIAKETIEQEFSILIKQKQDEIDELKAQWIGLIEKSNKASAWTFEGLEPTKLLVFKAVLKLIEVEMTDTHYTQNLLYTLANHYAEKTPKVLFLSPCFVSQVNDFVDSRKIQVEFEIQEDPSLLPGNYRLELANGEVSFDLDSALMDFKQQLKLLNRD